mmetsp:Transcript_19455/g.30487  ORF Transcript_19455/g.30487 Transcript_19455/m.30487 type:complete len:166 (-) Transcript_19455:18-515(-)
METELQQAIPWEFDLTRPIPPGIPDLILPSESEEEVVEPALPNTSEMNVLNIQQLDVTEPKEVPFQPTQSQNVNFSQTSQRSVENPMNPWDDCLDDPTAGVISTDSIMTPGRVFPAPTHPLTSKNGPVPHEEMHTDTDDDVIFVPAPVSQSSQSSQSKRRRKRGN